MPLPTQETFVPTAIPTPIQSPNPEEVEATNSIQQPDFERIIISKIKNGYMPLPTRDVLTSESESGSEDESETKALLPEESIVITSIEMPFPCFEATFPQPTRKITPEEIEFILRSELKKLEFNKFHFDDETGCMIAILPSTHGFPYGKKIIFTVSREEMAPKALLSRTNSDGSDNFICQLNWESN